MRRAIYAVRSIPDGWEDMCSLVGLFSIILGSGYAWGGSAATTTPGWGVLCGPALLGHLGGLHTHGAIMVMLGVGVALRGHGHLLGRLQEPALRALSVYSLLVAICWLASWWRFGFNWGAPVWWALLAALTQWLRYHRPSESPPAPIQRGRPGRV